MNSDFFSGNRRRLVETLPDSLIVITANSKMQSNGHFSFRFKQDSNFWWLTGIDQPDWLLVIDSVAGSDYLVSPDLSDVAKLFDGGISDEQATEKSGVSEVISFSDFSERLNNLTKKYDSVQMINNISDSQNKLVINSAHAKLNQLLSSKFNTVDDCKSVVEKLRSIKQAVEIQAMRQAIDLTTDAFSRVKSQINDYEYEYQIESSLKYSFRNSGAQGEAFDTIVAGGKNACTLHYSSNQDRLIPGNFVLIDAGAGMDGYSADISRTYAFGEVSQRQKDVHNAVFQASRQVINLLKPGLRFTDYHQQVETIMSDAVRQLGLPWDNNQYKKYFPHSIGHGLGIDAHDPLAQWQEFMPGMVVTVEPGIYIPDESIGVRIEDDILITDTGNENLSQSLSTEM